MTFRAFSSSKLLKVVHDNRISNEEIPWLFELSGHGLSIGAKMELMERLKEKSCSVKVWPNLGKNKWNYIWSITAIRF